MIRDFHTHTTFSDGTLTPEELVEACYKRGITELGITDHYATKKYSKKFQVMDVNKYVRTLSALREKKTDIKIHIGLEVDFSNVYGQNPETLDFNQMNQVEYLLFEHVNTKEVEGNLVHGRQLEELVNIRNKFHGPVGLAHNNFQQNFQGCIEETLITMKENNIFLELCEAEDKGKKAVNELLLQQMMEIRKNFNSAFEIKEILEKLKKKETGVDVHMKHAIDGKYYFELFEDSTWELIQKYNIGISVSSDSHKGIQLGNSKKVTPYIKKYQLEKQMVFR